MNVTFADYPDVFLVVYLDDLLIHSLICERHLQPIEMVLSSLKLHELYFGKDRCSFTQEKIELLRLIVKKGA